jgi:hypothetical protein
VKTLTAADKAAIGARCERFIAEVLKPRFLPEVRPTEFNYPRRYRRQMAGEQTQLNHALSLDEFDARFTRLDHAYEHTAGVRFDIK